MCSEAHIVCDLWGEAERAGYIRPGKGKGEGQLSSDSLWAGYRKNRERLFLEVSRKKFLLVRELKHWNRMARKMIGSPSSEIPKLNWATSGQVDLTLKLLLFEEDKTSILAYTFSKVAHIYIYTNLLLKKQQIYTKWSLHLCYVYYIHIWLNQLILKGLKKIQNWIALIMLHFIFKSILYLHSKSPCGVYSPSVHKHFIVKSLDMLVFPHEAGLFAFAGHLLLLFFFFSIFQGCLISFYCFSMWS